jgi:hypothetical protein
MIETAYEEERDRVEEEWKRGRDTIRKRLLEGIEERRRRAREEKDGEGNVGGSQISSPLLGGLTNMHMLSRYHVGFAISAAYNEKAQKPTWGIASSLASDDDSQWQCPWSCDDRTARQPTLTVNRRATLTIPPSSHFNTATLWQLWGHNWWQWTKTKQRRRVPSSNSWWAG